MQKEKRVEWALDIIKKAIDEQIYGSVIIKLEKGTITLAKTERTERPL
jgi:hypothetical protein